MIGGQGDPPNGFPWKINCGQKSLVSIKKKPLYNQSLGGGKSLQIAFELLSWGLLV